MKLQDWRRDWSDRLILMVGAVLNSAIVVQDALEGRVFNQVLDGGSLLAALLGVLLLALDFLGLVLWPDGEDG